MQLGISPWIRHVEKMQLRPVPRHLVGYIGLPDGRGAIERPKLL
jgi:hypothetical protein